jgi:hypothetical protein
MRFQKGSRNSQNVPNSTSLLKGGREFFFPFFPGSQYGLLGSQLVLISGSQWVPQVPIVFPNIVYIPPHFYPILV